MLNILRVHMMYDFKICQMKMQMTSYECIMVNVRGQCSWCAGWIFAGGSTGTSMFVDFGGQGSQVVEKEWVKING